MIYQHFKLVKPFSVAENIVLGDDHVKVINKKKLEARVKALSERYCIEIDPGALTWQLIDRRAAAGRNPEGAVPQCKHPDFGRADGRADGSRRCRSCSLRSVK